MNKKKLVGNLFLIAFVVGLGLSFVDFKSGPDTYEGSIQSFIYDRLAEDGQNLHYTPLTFEEINEPFLLSKTAVTEPLQVVSDSMRNQLKLMENAANSIEFKALLTNAENQMKTFVLGDIAELLRMDASLKREVKRSDNLSAKDKAVLYEEETWMMNAINELNTVLGAYNLSVFSIDFEQTETRLYYHTFLLSEDNSVNISNHRAVFELNREDKTVVSYNEI